MTVNKFHALPQHFPPSAPRSVLAYQCVQLMRRQLKAKGIDQRWPGLRETSSGQRRVTARFTQKDGRSVNVRKATQPEPELKAIYEALGLPSLPGGTKKIVVCA